MPLRDPPAKNLAIFRKFAPRWPSAGLALRDILRTTAHGVALSVRTWRLREILPGHSGAKARAEPPKVADDLEAADALPSRPGWAHRDWVPSLAGPLDRLAVDCQTQPDPSDNGELPSPWRFGVTVVSAAGHEIAFLGRLDRSGLHLLVRTDRATGALIAAELRALAGSKALSDRIAVATSFDLQSGPLASSAQMPAVDRRV